MIRRIDLLGGFEKLGRRQVLNVGELGLRRVAGPEDGPIEERRDRNGVEAASQVGPCVDEM